MQRTKSASNARRGTVQNQNVADQTGGFGGEYWWGKFNFLKNQISDWTENFRMGVKFWNPLTHVKFWNPLEKEGSEEKKE